MAVKGDYIQRTIRSFAAAVEAQGIIIEKSPLFGSHARGRAVDDSDIDLIVISDDFAPLAVW